MQDNIKDILKKMLSDPKMKKAMKENNDRWEIKAKKEKNKKK